MQQLYLVNIFSSSQKIFGLHKYNFIYQIKEFSGVLPRKQITQLPQQKLRMVKTKSLNVVYFSSAYSNQMNQCSANQLKIPIHIFLHSALTPTSPKYLCTLPQNPFQLQRLRGSQDQWLHRLRQRCWHSINNVNFFCKKPKEFPEAFSFITLVSMARPEWLFHFSGSHSLLVVTFARWPSTVIS